MKSTRTITLAAGALASLSLLLFYPFQTVQAAKQGGVGDLVCSFKCDSQGYTIYIYEYYVSVSRDQIHEYSDADYVIQLFGSISPVPTQGTVTHHKNVPQDKPFCSKTGARLYGTVYEISRPNTYSQGEVDNWIQSNQAQKNSCPSSLNMARTMVIQNGGPNLPGCGDRDCRTNVKPLGAEGSGGTGIGEGLPEGAGMRTFVYRALQPDFNWTLPLMIAEDVQMQLPPAGSGPGYRPAPSAIGSYRLLTPPVSRPPKVTPGAVIPFAWPAESELALIYDPWRWGSDKVLVVELRLLVPKPVQLLPEEMRNMTRKAVQNYQRIVNAFAAATPYAAMRPGRSFTLPVMFLLPRQEGGYLPDWEVGPDDDRKGFVAIETIVSYPREGVGRFIVPRANLRIAAPTAQGGLGAPSQ